MTRHPRRRPLRSALATATIAVVSFRAGTARSAAEAPQIVVLAEPRFEVERQARVADRLELRVRLLDDRGVAVPRASVSVGAGDRELAASTCGGSEQPPRIRHALTTDAEGAICVRVAGDTESLHLAYRGSSLHLPAEAQIALQATADLPPLRFELPSLELDLDQPLHELRLLGAGVSSERAELELELSDNGRRISLDIVDPVEHRDDLVFQIRSEDLGSPGPARIVARQRAGGELRSAEAVALRLARVELTAEVVAVEAASGSIQVTARTRQGPPTSGWIDADAEGQTVASAPLVEGAARLDVPLTDSRPRQLRLLYRPEESFWLAGTPLEITLEAGAVRATRWPWLVLLAPVGYVCSRALLRPGPPRPRRRAKPTRTDAEVLQVAPSRSATGWSGVVRDAHEGTPIEGARVQITLPSLRDPLVHAVAITDANGRYALPPLTSAIPEGASLQVGARLHTEVHRSLPPQGRVDVALSSRRRALLRRLVRWARAAGPPWHGRSEPTPGEIADVALRRGDVAIAHWAEQVAEVAFGAAEVDSAREAELRRREPGAHPVLPPQAQSHDD